MLRSMKPEQLGKIWPSSVLAVTDALVLRILCTAPKQRMPGGAAQPLIVWRIGLQLFGHRHRIAKLLHQAIDQLLRLGPHCAQGFARVCVQLLGVAGRVSHSRTVKSPDPETRVAPSGLKSREITYSVCPRS